MVESVKTRMTMAEFLAMPETTQIVELIAGEAYVNAPFDQHQAVVGAVHLFLGSLKLGGKLRTAPPAFTSMTRTILSRMCSGSARRTRAASWSMANTGMARPIWWSKCCQPAPHGAIEKR